MPEGKYFWIRSHLNDLCLDLSNGKAEAQNDVITWEFREAPHQIWFEDQAHHVIRSKADENLVLEERDDGRVIINNFHRGKDEQEWVVEDGKICRRHHRDRVLHIVDGQHDHAGHLCVEHFEGKPEQKWDAVHLDSPYFIITSQLHGKALDIEGADGSPGANVITWDHHGNDNQQWFEDKHGFIRSKMNGYTFNTRDGHLEMDDLEVGHSASTWVRDGDAIINRFDPDQCLEIEDSCEDNCAKIVPGSYQYRPHQRWNFQNVD